MGAVCSSNSIIDNSRMRDHSSLKSIKTSKDNTRLSNEDTEKILFGDRRMSKGSNASHSSSGSSCSNYSSVNHTQSYKSGLVSYKRKNNRRIHNPYSHQSKQEEPHLMKTQSAKLPYIKKLETNQTSQGLKKSKTATEKLPEMNGLFQPNNSESDNKCKAVAKAQAAVQRKRQDPRTKILRANLENFEFPSIKTS